MLARAGLLLLLALVPRALLAQAALTHVDDATLVPHGIFRLRALTAWTRAHERYDAEGRVSPLFGLSRDSLGAAELPLLRPAEAAIRALVADPTFRLSIAETRANVDVRSVVTPIAAEYGLTRRISLSLVVPIVQHRTDLALLVNPRRDSAANVGLNPARATASARSQNGQVVAQLDAAAATLRARLQACGTRPTDPGCPALLQDPSRAQALLDATAAAAASLRAVYGSDATRSGSLVVPLAQSTTHGRVRARIDTLDSRYRALLAQTTPLISARPAGAPVPIGRRDLVALLVDSTLGIALDTLASAERRGIGDVEVGATMLLFERRALRSPAGARDTAARESYVRSRAMVSGILRLGTGAQRPATALLALGIGDGQTDVEVRGVHDMMFTRRFALSSAARLTYQFGDQMEVRVPEAPSVVFPDAFATVLAERQLGSMIDLELTPRLLLADALGLAAHYGLHWRGATRYSGTRQVGAELTGGRGPLALDAAVLSDPGSSIEHRVGFGLRYSTLPAFEAGRARLPFEVSYAHLESLRGRSTEKVSREQLQLRWYYRIRR